MSRIEVLRPWARRLTVLVVVVLVALVGAPSCVIAPPQDFPSHWEGYLVQGACMCAKCWDRPFCAPETGRDEDFEEANPDGSCPTAGYQAAQQISDINAALTGRNPRNIWCIQPTDKTIAQTQVQCPDGDAVAAFSGVDDCKDIPPTCTKDECSLHVEGPCGVEVPQGHLRSACRPWTQSGVLTEIEAAEKLRDHSCGEIHPEPEPGQPSRFCWLNCVRTFNDGSDPDSGRACDPELTDPPEVRADSYVAQVDPARSFVLIDVAADGEQSSAELPIVGELALSVSRDCRPPLSGFDPCDQVTLTLLDLRATQSASLLGATVSEIGLSLPIPLAADAAKGITSVLVPFDPGAMLVGSARVGGSARATIPYESPNGPLLVIDWETREVVVITTVSGEADGFTSSLVLALTATINNLVPTADAGPDLEICGDQDGALVHLSAAASSDLDGPQDLASFAWSSPSGFFASGSEVDLQLPVGAHLFDLTVTDQKGAASTDTVVVNVAGGTSVQATLTVTGDWGQGYCVQLEAHNPTSEPIPLWSVLVNLNASSVYTSWNGMLSGAAGVVEVRPGFDWNRVLAPGETDGSIGFCANRDVPDSGKVPFVVVEGS